MWTKFMDMHSGGKAKIPPYEYILIQGSEQDATDIFRKRFDRDPDNVTCACCGEDFSVSSSDCLQDLTEYERGHLGMSVEQFGERSDVLVIRADV